ncbi:MAG: type II toxin-antitoxin system RelE/ParE family toxin [Nitrososphaerota archaeon]|nr:type II toxin-antitoxin system RelE/ParE family toxin [Nitrososphaerota archaeon]
MYSLEARERVDRTFRKIAKRDPRQMEAIGRKIQEILDDPHMSKPMRFPLSGVRKVHLGSYVLLYSIDEQRKTVVLEDYEHHDRVSKA